MKCPHRCFTDGSGNVLTASSAGACGFRGSKKGTAYAAQVAAERAAQAAKQQYGFSKADVFIKDDGLFLEKGETIEKDLQKARERYAKQYLEQA